MKKNVSLTKETGGKEKATLATGTTSIIVAFIAFLGTLATAYFGYLGIRYKSEQPTRPTEAPVAQVEAVVSHVACDIFAIILPADIDPQEQTYNKLMEHPDFNDWAVAPHFNELLSGDAPPNSIGKLMQASITIGNASTTNGGWVKINNRLGINFDLMLQDIEEHVNLVAMVPDGCGGGETKLFSPTNLKPEFGLINQFVTSSRYDFFSLQPGESDVFRIDYICASPGIYHTSVHLSLESSNGSEKQEITGFPKMMCPKSYHAWRAFLGDSPLEDVGEYYWDGNNYIQQP